MGSDLIYKTFEKVYIIRNRLQTAYSRQKSYADHRRRNLEFEEGDKVYLKISHMKGVVRFGNKGKLRTLRFPMSKSCLVNWLGSSDFPCFYA